MKKGRDKLQTIFVDIRGYFEISKFETTRAKCTSRIQGKNDRVIILRTISIVIYYSRLSLSRLRLSRITAYLEEKFWSLF